MDTVKTALKRKPIELSALEIIALKVAVTLARRQYKQFADNGQGIGDYWEQEVKACDKLLKMLYP